MRLIDADNIKMIMARGTLYGVDDEVYVSLNDVRKAVAQAPTVDAVPVVRCKDCTLREDGNWCAIHGHKIYMTDFCNYGARKDGAVNG